MDRSENDADNDTCCCCYYAVADAASWLDTVERLVDSNLFLVVYLVFVVRVLLLARSVSVFAATVARTVINIDDRL